MPDPSKLSTASGQLGPVCAVTGKALTFGEAIVLDGEYLCQAAIVLPERMHWAHTRVFLRFPPGLRIRTVCKFGIQRLFVLLLA